MSKIHFIGGDKGGVGKSVVARVLVAWCTERGLPFRAFDADGSHGALLRHYPAQAQPVALAELAQADRLLASAAELSQGRVVVDLPARGDSAVAAWLAESDLVTLAASLGIELVFWHVMDDGKDAIAALGRALQRHPPPARHVIVENLGRGFRFALFDQSAVRAAADAAQVPVIQLPELHPPAMRKLDRSDASFKAAIEDHSFGVGVFGPADRQRVKVWLLACFDQLARLGPDVI
jgi:hypothetical protein